MLFYNIRGRVRVRRRGRETRDIIKPTRSRPRARTRGLLLNPKLEIRNPKQIQNHKFKCSKQVLNLVNLVFEIVSTNFIKSGEIRISNFITK